jgi:hypothetical protein
MDAEVVLKRFNTTSEQDGASELGQHGDGGSWRELREFYEASVPEKSKVEARQFKASLLSPQAQNELLHHENDGLNRALDAKKKQDEEQDYEPSTAQKVSRWRHFLVSKEGSRGRETGRSRAVTTPKSSR